MPKGAISFFFLEIDGEGEARGGCPSAEGDDPQHHVEDIIRCRSLQEVSAGPL